MLGFQDLHPVGGSRSQFEWVNRDGNHPYFQEKLYLGAISFCSRLHEKHNNYSSMMITITISAVNKGRFSWNSFYYG